MFINHDKQKTYNIWDPFMGTGSTGEAAMLTEGCFFFGSDKDGNCFRVRSNFFIDFL
tara:strand:- start:511 stop:681 length:171 start_codon:yes stop_codon:yes gene_type:complete